MGAILAVVLSIPINYVLWPITQPLWNTFIHQPVLEQAKDAELANRILLYTVDVGAGVLFMVGIGFMLAWAGVQAAANWLSRL